ncbi:endonuclease domain-containing protein [Bradyrhizobium sp. AUGA SZCCT0431]|uniref:endonuclease domain-containing protein n=1 Tax=Bradyrhizobium sp. AUGA SZCCT0431 TaxID=2807674 RepID=UPI00289EAB90|nr:endonuclease domain-containing protein [Bradyrhizobium sp. AUGA SZCCT0431]
MGEGGAERSSATGEGFSPLAPSHRPVAKRLRNFARSMRRGPTDAELAMWRLLRDRRLARFKFRRQVPFQSFILDFVCFEKRLIIEIDGSQHASSTRDEARDAALIAEGFRIARYWNNDVLLQPSAVLEDVFAKLAQP